MIACITFSLLIKCNLMLTTPISFQIDAGSTGTRLHLYEWNPRTLRSEREVEDAVTGGRLSYPGTDSRWTDRLSPGLATFAALPDDQLVDGIAAYLQPLMDFATTVLHTKQAEFASFPVYLRATAGMRVITQVDRARVVSAVRTLFSNNTYCPFQFEDEQVRVLSGEEEAIFGWAGVNFLLGTLIEDSEGSGTVNEPRLTYGALDMGGASTQISFYEPNGEIMANLFKLQIGQGKHWNLYAHSFLFYGINEAENRLVAKLINEKSWTERLIHGINNPCYFGGTIRNVRSEMHINADGYETWANVTDEKYGVDESSNDGYLNAILRNDDSGGNFDLCMELAYHLLHKEQNEWCNFSHRGDCSFAGIYQPDLPEQSTKYGEFLAFSNYYAVWTFLGLPSRSSLRDVQVAARTYCEMSLEDVTNIAGHRLEDGEDIVDYCFRSVYVFQILHNGYGFELDDYVTSAGVVSGQKVGWALGAMLYEINTLPWHYDPVSLPGSGHPIATGVFSVLVLVLCIGLYSVFRAQRKRRAQREGYDFIKTISA
jgi:Golgi nucleoside diphosphatase